MYKSRNVRQRRGSSIREQREIRKRKIDLICRNSLSSSFICSCNVMLYFIHLFCNVEQFQHTIIDHFRSPFQSFPTNRNSQVHSHNMVEQERAKLENEKRIAKSQ